MRKTSLLKQLYYCHFARPSHERKLYQTATQGEFHTVVEIGISSVQRTCRFLEIAHRFTEEPIQYWGIDPFKVGAIGQKQVGLRFAHVELKKTGATVKLIPGDLFSSLSRSSNLLTGTDLLIIGGDVDDDSILSSWFYLPRMLHEDSLVLIETGIDDEIAFEEWDFDAVLARSESLFGNARRAA